MSGNERYLQMIFVCATCNISIIVSKCEAKGRTFWRTLILVVPFACIKMTSCNGLFVGVTGHLWGESTGQKSLVDSSYIGLVTWIFYVSFCVCLNNRLCSCWRFVVPWCPYEITVMIFWDANVVGHHWIGRRRSNQRINDISRHDTNWIFRHDCFCQMFCSFKRFDTFVKGVISFKMSNESQGNILALTEVQCTLKGSWFPSRGLIYPARDRCIVSNVFLCHFSFLWNGLWDLLDRLQRLSKKKKKKNSWVNKYYVVQYVCFKLTLWYFAHIHKLSYSYPIYSNILQIYCRQNTKCNHDSQSASYETFFPTR